MQNNDAGLLAFLYCFAMICWAYLICLVWFITNKSTFLKYKISKNKTIPIHKFTYTGNKVLLLRSGEIGYEGFQWPKSGKVICPKAKANPEQAKTPYCGSGGLFGWPWGIGIGDGKQPNFTQNWIVFAANPKDVIQVDRKAKAIGECEVVYCGPWYECFKIVEEGKIAWLKAQNNNAATSEPYSTAATSEPYSTAATNGYGSTAATSGDYSTAATSRYCSTAATSGPNSTAATSRYRSTAATSGEYSTAATSGEYSTAATSGGYSTASTSGEYSTAATSGNDSTAATSGYRSTATTSGDNSTAATNGYGSTAATSGPNSTATTSGEYSTAITNKNNSIAVGTGQECEIKALGKHSIAATTGENPTIEVASQSVGVVVAEEFTWRAHPGAVVFQKWNSGDAVLRWNQQPAVIQVHNGRIINN